MAVDKIQFPYRSGSHCALLHVISESGSWEKHGLDVEYNYKITSKDAHRKVPTSDVEFVGGNHVSTYAHRARGDSWVYLGQTLNFTNFKLVTSQDSGINKVSDLFQKKVASKGSHPGLNDWIYLKQRGLDVDKDQIDLQKQVPDGQLDERPGQRSKQLDDLILEGKVDAAFITPPRSIMAGRRGLKVIDIDPLPMVWFTTISTSLKFAERHPDIVERFLKGIMEGIHFFKTQPGKATQIIKERHTAEGKLDDEMAKLLYTELARILEPKLYPSIQAVSNVYEEAVRQDKEALKVSPMALWDTHAIRKIDDSGWVEELYKDQPSLTVSPSAGRQGYAAWDRALGGAPSIEKAEVESLRGVRRIE
jgi:ABC-type nitrate/sulfonate/bicarbonate transport system substrate-binding protein